MADWRETDERRTSREAVLTDLMDGQFSDPVRIVAFNTREGWSRDVSQEFADLLAREREIPAFLEAFVDQYRNR